MVNNVKQWILGKDNFQISIGNINYNAKDVCQGIGDLFRKYDERINNTFTDGIEFSKTKEKQAFKSSKIFSSLVKVDIPFENALHIVYIVILTLMEGIDSGKYEEGLSTHKLRRIVEDSILNYSDTDVSENEKEIWADKYIRRYGHDSQQIEVYFNNSLDVKKLNFDFIKSVLLDDIFEELGIRDMAYRHDIPSTQISTISREILEFINDCNMYKINYNILKEYIIEMALQPPHPWFVTEKTAKYITEYDLRVLERHYEKLCKAQVNNSYDDLYYTVYEALHHSCSSILTRYYEVLGCKDLDVFYNLVRITKKLYKRSEEDLVIEKQNVCEFPNDLRYISWDLSEFYNLLKRIEAKLSTGKTICMLDAEFVSDIKKLCDIAKALDNKADKNELKEFLDSEWKQVSHEQKKKCIRKIFEVIEGLKVTGYLSKSSDCFWIKRGMNREREIFAICMDEFTNLEAIKDYFKSNKKTLHTEAIFVIIEYTNDRMKFDRFIKELENDRYFIEIVNKEDLKNIFFSNNKYSAFNAIVNREIYSI